jgi:peroxiredoxin
MIKKLTIAIVIVLVAQLSYSQKNLPELILKDINGKSVSIKELAKDKTLVFSFWASWCGPCINELDAIAEQYEDLQDEMEFELIAVSVDDTRTKSRVKPLVNGKGWDYQILFDSNQKFKRAMNIATVPFVMIVKNGKIEYSHLGYSPGSEEELIEKFKSIK